MLLSQADQAIGRLDGASQTLPNPDLFVAMYVRREAVESSAIEGTQSTLQDVLAFELNPSFRSLPDDVEEVVNYVQAMNHGLQCLATLPLFLRLIREIHAELMQGVRGGDKAPGEFRRTQNWIGPAGATLETATFVPPPVPEMMDALGDLEKFLHRPGAAVMHHLVRCDSHHATFRTGNSSCPVSTWMDMSAGTSIIKTHAGSGCICSPLAHNLIESRQAEHPVVCRFGSHIDILYSGEEEHHLARRRCGRFPGPARNAVKPLHGSRLHRFVSWWGKCLQGTQQWNPVTAVQERSRHPQDIPADDDSRRNAGGAEYLFGPIQYGDQPVS